MKIGERGLETIPQKYRHRFGLTPAMEVEFLDENGRLVLKKAGSKTPAIRKFSGILKGQGLRSDEVVDEMRGR